jgi:hypothetical protein
MADKAPKKKAVKKTSDSEAKVKKPKAVKKPAKTAEAPVVKKTVRPKKSAEVHEVTSPTKAQKPRNIANLTDHKMSSETEEAEIEASKFSSPEPKEEKPAAEKPVPGQPQVFQRHETTIPEKYGDNKIVMMARDPHWCYVYWDLAVDHMANKAKGINEAYDLTLRVHDITDTAFNGTNSHKFIDIQVNGEAGNWYVNVWEAGRTYLVDIGYKTKSGKFILLARSNAVITPQDKVSNITDEEWMIVDEDFEELWRLSAGGATGRVGGASEGFRSPLETGLNASSETVSSFSSPVGGGPKGRKFFLNADTEVIIYGSTEKDAKLTVRGEKTPLKEDGTFSLRFHLPNGKMDLPVEAVSADGIDKLTIKISVERKTE